MDKHRNQLKQNPRLNMLIKNLDKMNDQKKNNHLNNANSFLNNL